MELIKSVSGVRGIVEPSADRAVTLTAQVAADLGRAFATFLRRSGRLVSERPAIVLAARDGRPSGPGLLTAFAEGALRSGVYVEPLGVISTPGAGLAVAEGYRQNRLAGGVVITASHNPQEYNGIKLLLEEGRAPSAAEADDIFDLFDRRDFDHASQAGTRPGALVADACELHVDRVLRQVNVSGIRARGFRVLLDSVNGAGGREGRLLLDRLGCRVTHQHDTPDAGFPRHPEPTAENLKDVCRAVAAASVDVGFVQDPDADRLAIFDETGRYIGEEYTLALAAWHVFSTRPGAIVANLSTSRMIDDLANRFGSPCRVARSAVGEANVVEVMKRDHAHLGGEGNGGVIHPHVVWIRDSLVAMALTLQLLADDGRPLSALVAELPRYAMVKQKIECDRPRIDQALAAVERSFAGQRQNDLDGLRIDWPDGWVHVRASNTEPIVRIIAEALEAVTANHLIDQVRAAAGV